MNDDLQSALLDAEAALREAIDRCEELAAQCEELNAGEDGIAHKRMQSYIIPSLTDWLYDEDQIGSLASIREELEANQSGE